jgi:hypothetical protein
MMQISSVGFNKLSPHYRCMNHSQVSLKNGYELWLHPRWSCASELGSTRDEAALLSLAPPKMAPCFSTWLHLRRSRATEYGFAWCEAKRKIILWNLFKTRLFYEMFRKLGQFNFSKLTSATAYRCRARCVCYRTNCYCLFLYVRFSNSWLCFN